MIKKTYKKSEVVEMLTAMERKAREVLKMAETAESEATKNSFGMYDEFVRKATDFDTLAILVEQRIANMDMAVDNRPELEEQYDSLKMLVAHGLIKASMKFFFVLSTATTLPLGARNLFSSELRRLYTLKNELNSPKYEGKLGEEKLADLETAELILQEIIDKAPSMLNFSG
jgi:hypothetical protein